jgi:hypothetical protein
MRNDLIAQKSGEHYTPGTPDPSLYAGTNNLWFGAGAAPSFDASAVTGDPLLASPTTFDFHLKSGSAAIDHGVVTEATFDFDGNARPQGAAFDIGAYEFAK